MEPPLSFAAESVRDEKVKVLKSVRPHPPEASPADWAVRAQYDAGEERGTLAYRNEPGVAADSDTETFAAMRLFIDNWRWHDVPFYLRSGKRMGKRLTQISIVFKPIPYSLFHPLEVRDFSPNVLVLRIQPNEGGLLQMQVKRPGPKLCMGAIEMGFDYERAFGEAIPDAYERLLLDAMLGDQTLFLRNDTIREAWRILQPVLDDWNKPLGEARTPLHFYPSGTWGPEAACELLARDGRQWQVFE